MLKHMKVGLLLVGKDEFFVTNTKNTDLVQNTYREHDVTTDIIPDEAGQIRRVLRLWTDVQNLNLILTLGGTGLSMRDNVPTVTNELLERPMYGLVELMRLVGVQQTRSAAMWRLFAGQRSKSLIVNLPSDHLDVALSAVQPVLARAVEEIQEGILKQTLF